MSLTLPWQLSYRLAFRSQREATNFRDWSCHCMRSLSRGCANLVAVGLGASLQHDLSWIENVKSVRLSSRGG